MCIRDSVKALGGKTYWENIESPDFTVMFLPSEHLYSMALRADPSLVEYAAQKDVIIASPTLLMSLLRVVSLSWRQVELAQNAQEISERGLDLYKRLVTFSGHMEKIGKGLKNALEGYNFAVGSLERNVLPAARKFKDLQRQTQGAELPASEPQDDNIRHLTLAAEDELFPYCQAHNIAVIARVPFDEGSLTGTLTIDSTWPEGDWRNTYFVPENLYASVDRAEALRPLIPADMNMAQMAMRFILNEPTVSTIIPGMRKAKHVRENIATSNAGPLPAAQQVAQIVRKALPQRVRARLQALACLLYTSPSPRDRTRSRMPSSA